MAAPDDTAAFGSFEWAKQVVTDANAGVLAMAHEGIGSPQLDERLRSRHQAALDIAVNRLLRINTLTTGTGSRSFEDALRDLLLIAEEARRALRCIADLVPEALKGEPQ